MKLNWFHQNTRPSSKEDVEVIAKVEGFTQESASPFDIYEIVTYRPALNCFLRWEDGETIYFNKKGNDPHSCRVTYWAYFNKVDED